MITSRVFHKEVPSVEGELFRFIGGSGLGSGLILILENEHAANSLTYKVQESTDGTTWTDKALPTSSGTAVSFTVGPKTAHTVRLPATSNHYRVKASGTLTANIGLLWFTLVAPESTSVPTILA